MTRTIHKYRGQHSPPIRSLPFALGLPMIYAVWLWFASRGAGDDTTVLWFGCIGLVSLAMLTIDISHHPYSLVSMGWAFLFLFVGVAGAWQYINAELLYYDQLANSSAIHEALFAISLWIAFFAVGVWFGHQRLKPRLRVARRWDRALRSSDTFVVVTTVFSLAIVAYLLLQGGVDMLFSREATSEALDRGTIAKSQMIGTLRNFPIYTFALSAKYAQKTGNRRMLVALQLVFVLLSNSPLAIPRFNVAVVYLGLALLLLPRFGKGVRFITAFLAAFLLLFPALSMFRRTSPQGMTPGNIFDSAGSLFFGFSSGDYDSFSMIGYATRYVSDFGPTFGFQLLGPLLFFIPRAIWPEKPIGSGAHILTTYGQDFTNGSAPLVAEGLINFGLLGVIAFALFFGTLTSKMDKYYWELSSEGNLTYFTTLYPFIIPLYFFMNRGDLLSSFAYAVTHVLAYSIVFIFNDLLSATGSHPPRISHAI